MSRINRRFIAPVFIFSCCFLAVFAFLTTKDTELASSASLANFRPGYIVSDYVLSNYNSMTEAEIQAFLKSKNPCNDTNIAKANNYPHLNYHIKDGHFVCLADELFGEGIAYGGTTGETAAHIIWQAAQDYQINPQALIVLLQKEQGLITDTWPNHRQYRAATGYGCPDTAPCNSEYYGFKNQVRKAAELYRTVLNGGWTNYPLGNNYIQYHPDPGCGGSTVNIENLATSALYRYTPYQPNAGALAASYGTAACGAYGNRNFYLFFSDWFGDPTAGYNVRLGRTIPDGVYQISAKDDSNKSFDLRGGIIDGMTSGELIVFKTKKEDIKNQTFEVQYNTNSGYYQIFNPATNLYITMNDNNTVSLETKRNTCNQNWNLERDSNRHYSIASACFNTRINYINDNKVVVVESDYGKKQRWKFFEISDDTHALEDGTYQIVSRVNSEYAMEIKGDVFSDTTSGRIGLWNKKDLNYNIENQIFDIKYNPETGLYNIINKLSKLSLDVRRSGSADGTDILAWPYNGGCNQQWLIRRTADSYQIISACNGKTLDIKGGAATRGEVVHLWTLHNGNNQKWQFKEFSEKLYNGTYQIISKLSPSFSIDISGGVSKDMALGHAINFSLHQPPQDNQVFDIIYDDIKKNYIIKNPLSGLYMDIEGDPHTNSSRIIFSQENNNCSQRWVIERDIRGFFTIFSSCSDKVLDISGGQAVNSKPIILFDSHQGLNQRWSLIRQ